MKYSEFRQLILEELFPNRQWVRSWGGTWDMWGSSRTIGPVDMYKNPPSIRRFDKFTRAISTPNGDLYVADSLNLIHDDIVDYLEEYEGYDTFKVAPVYWAEDLGKLYMGWVKYEKNILCLSESTNMKYFKKYYETPKFKQHLENLQVKHKGIIFELSNIDELDWPPLPKGL